MIKSVLCLAAVAAVLAAATGCGGASSSGDAPRDQSTGFSAAESTAGGDAPKPTPDEAKPDKMVKPSVGDTPVPIGTPVDARDKRVRRAIADLLHPKRSGKGSEPQPEVRSQGDSDDDRSGVLGRILRDLRKRTQQPVPEDHPSDDGGGIGILEMLK